MSEAEDEPTVNRMIRFYDESRIRLGEAESLAELREDILRASFQKGTVQLDSGVEQPYFFEKYLIVARPTILRRLARFLAGRVPAGTDRVAAPTLGAVSVGTAVSLESGLPLAIVRSNDSHEPDRRAVEGGVHPGEVAVLIEDVVVTGQRALRAVEKLRAAGVRVDLVVSVIDCDRGAATRFARAGLDYDPLFSSSATGRHLMTRADPAEISRHLEELSAIGADPRGGFSRLVFTDREREAHALFRAWLEANGLETSTDTVGNSFGTLAGSENLPAVMSGSHLDTVYQGGNFDGAVGVVAAVEIARILAEEGGLRHPLRVVAFAGEEGARFGAPCIGSRLMTGAFTGDTLTQLRDRDTVTAWDAAKQVGLHPERAHEAQWDSSDVECFVEVHIEQGRVLEAREHTLGIVHTIGGSTRVELSFEGRADHSGATPMWLRRDALTAAAEFITTVEHRAQRHATSVATVGTVDVRPGSLTTVPGRVVLGLDVRDIDSERQRELAETLLDDALRIATGREVVVTARQLSDQSPVVLHGTVQNLLASAAVRQDLPFISMPSGASHDSAHLARQVPTGMLFIPCREGISHAPEEHAEPEHISRAVDVVVDAFRAIDAGTRV